DAGVPGHQGVLEGIPGAGGEGGRRSARVLPPALLVRPGPGARPGRRGHEEPRPAEAGRLPPRHRVQHGRRQGEVREERRVGEGTHPHGPVPEGPRHGHRSVPRAGQEGGALPRGAQVRRHRLPVRRGEELARALLFSWDLLANAVVAGLLLGGFYAAVSLGVSLIFGLLDIANIAQPAFVILGAYAAYVMNRSFGLDAILTGLLFTTVALPLFRSRPFYGRAGRAVCHDRLALRLTGADPVRIKTIGFGVGMAAASLAGALLITIAPVVPSTDRDYIGRMFAITVL